MEATAIQKLESLLLVSVPQDLTDDDVLWLRRQVLRRIRQHHSRLVLLDFGLVEICDSFFGRFIQSMAEMAKLMGAKVIISGLQDAVVETLVELGLTLPNIEAVLDLDDALALSRTEQLALGQAAEYSSSTSEDERPMRASGESTDWDAPEADSLEV
ncbi:MAG: STAS domain-containing protein [Anaerolineae bacterium]|jgi:rsbT antagonist protein RsbS